MPDKETAIEPVPENSPAPSAPENLPQPPAENEQITASSSAPKAGVVEKIRAAASRVIGQAGFTFKKGRGRPKNCPACDGEGCDACDFTGKVPGKLDKPAEQIPQPVPIRTSEIPQTSFAPSTAVADSSRGEIFRRACKAAVKGCIEILKAVVSTYAGAAGVDAVFTRKALDKASPDDDALRDFTDSLDAVLKKHAVEPQHAEEIALAVNGARLLAPFALLLAEFKGEIARKRLAEKGAAE